MGRRYLNSTAFIRKEIRIELMTENTWMEHSVCDERCDLPDYYDLSGTKYGTSRYSGVGHRSSQASANICLDVVCGTL